MDKISILEIKLEKIKDKTSLEEIDKEYKILKNAQKLNVEISNDIEDKVNEENRSIKPNR